MHGETKRITASIRFEADFCHAYVWANLRRDLSREECAVSPDFVDLRLPTRSLKLSRHAALSLAGCLLAAVAVADQNQVAEFAEELPDWIREVVPEVVTELIDNDEPPDPGPDPGPDASGRAR